MPYEAHERLRSHRGVDLTGKLRVLAFAYIYCRTDVRSCQRLLKKRIEEAQKYNKYFDWIEAGCLSGTGVPVRSELETFCSTALLQSGTREKVVENNKKTEIILCENRMDSGAKNDYTVHSN